MDFFVRTLHEWYAGNQRDLPWRRTRDPYAIWISEVILQQTRISQGLPYYERFMERFPDAVALAEAGEDGLMKVWEGLGYYSRARNLQAAARRVVEQHNGRLPADFTLLTRLPGIGRYTAAAIASIAFGLPHAVVDGNVARLLARFYGIADPVDSAPGIRRLGQLASGLLDVSNPGDHNQALMEFGALCCVPVNPSCPQCPLSSACVAFRMGKTALLPLKKGRNPKRTRYFYFYLFGNDTHLWVEKRTGKDIWKNLYQLPLFESTGAMAAESLPANPFPQVFRTGAALKISSVSNETVHELTHQRIVARFISVALENGLSLPPGWIAVSKKEIHKFAYPVLTAKYLAKQGYGHRAGESGLLETG